MASENVKCFKGYFFRRGSCYLFFISQFCTNMTLVVLYFSLVTFDGAGLHRATTWPRHRRLTLVLAPARRASQIWSQPNP